MIKHAILESYLSVTKLAKICKKTPRRIRQLINVQEILAVDINKRLKRPYYLIPAKEAKRYIDTHKVRRN
jgi:plasmid maintenance system antidote protein VapI